MAYRNKTFVSFASEDIRYYYLMKAWKENKNIPFTFYDAHDLNVARDSSLDKTIQDKLTERLRNTKIVVMLIGEVTRAKAANPTSFIHHEVQTIKRLNLPIVFVNLNNKQSYDEARVPAGLSGHFNISVPFHAESLMGALQLMEDVAFSGEWSPASFCFPRDFYRKFGM